MEKVFMKGNEAIAEAGIRAGCRFFAGYPITPQNDIPEYMSRRMPEAGGVFVQGESEIASISMLMGSSFNGVKSMTSSSGPGLSLKAEGISTMAGMQLPAVIVNVMRGGPGTGAIQGAQMDYLMATKASGHGGFRMIVYAPSTVQEAVDYTIRAFDKAEQYQQPMLIAADGHIGAIMESVELPEMRPVVNMKEKYDFFPHPGFGQTRQQVYSVDLNLQVQEDFNKYLAEMYETWNRDEVLVEEYLLEDAEYVIVTYGTSTRVARAAIKALRDEGVKIGMIRPITIYPFPYDSIRKLDPNKVKKILCLELSIPVQVTEDVELGTQGLIPIESYGRAASLVFTPEEVVAYFNTIK
jgi:2-oxoglutarate ferredoxin oxidoreductase subunit alpha